MPGKEEADKRKRRQESKIEALPAEQDTACRASARRGCGSIDQRSKHVFSGQSLHRLRPFGPKSRYEKRGLSPKCDGPLTRAGPVSRVLFPDFGKPGPLSFIYDDGHPSPPATYPPASGEQPSFAGIHGLATRRTYCPERITASAVGSYPAFSPLPAAGAFAGATLCVRAVIFCYATIPSRVSSR